jgi:NAD(P) transhydrogenase subunit alpha
MLIGIPRETRPGETRVAATPETLKKLLASGKHEAVGARIADARAALAADLVLKVRAPAGDELAALAGGASLVGLLDPFDTAGLEAIARSGVNGFALERLPRITRAQSMDVLSSQANIAGYKAVIIAANEYARFMPMLMTAAGTVKAARVLVLGVGASIPDSEFAAAGATIVAAAAEAYQSDFVFKVRGPEASELPLLKRGSILIALLEPFNSAGISALAGTGVTGFALESIPRITRGQAMDVLSSQANIAGYKAVMLAANEYGRFMPMMMTAAGTVKAARVLILGAGVAGLQAIATAKRLGAVIEASDVRPAVKEQVESLGAKFLDVPYLTDEERQIAEGVGGYARPMPADWMRRQGEAVHAAALKSDIVITTALIPGRPAPKLIREATVAAMRPGSVILDLAVEQGGNVEGSELGKVVIRNGVHIIGFANLPGMLPADASALYSRNLLNLFNLLVDGKTGELTLDRSDDIVAGALVCIDGAPTTKEAARA